MLPSDSQRVAEEIARSLAGNNVVHFYDPQGRAGIQFVKDHFDAYLKAAFAAMAEDHPWREQVATQAAAPAIEKPLWDALFLFAPGAEWNEASPEADWWTRQVGFSADAAKDEPTGQFWRKGAEGVHTSDWFDEVREGLNIMQNRNEADHADVEYRRQISR